MSKFDANRNLTSSLKIESFFSRMEPVEIQLEFLNKKISWFTKNKNKNKKVRKMIPAAESFFPEKMLGAASIIIKKLTQQKNK